MQSLMSPAKTASLLRLLASVRHLEGCVAELGVYQGGTLKAMADAAPEKTCLGFDTFTGQPAASWREIDFHRPGEFADTALGVVKAAMPENVALVPGLFPESAIGVAVGICFAHVDFDLEKSTEDAIEWLRARMVSRGVIVFDDWHWKNCEGVARAIDRAGLQVQPGAPCQCYWVAP